MVKDTETLTKHLKNLEDSLYRVILSKAFRKSFKKYEKSGKPDMSKIQKIIEDLSRGFPLDSKYKDHQLKGNLKYCRECHISSDLLLIYFRQEEEKELYIVDIGTHSELF